MAKRDAQQGAGVESGLSEKVKITDKAPALSDKLTKPHKPMTPKDTSARDGHKIRG